MPRGLSPNVCNDIERNNAIPDECRFLNPTLHFCESWKGMLIDDSDPEFDHCRCGGGNDRNAG
jgi:hypothetical protein